MSADLLRAAADRLEAVIDKLTTDTARWDDSFPVTKVYGDHSTYERLIVHPEVGRALAAWLRVEAFSVEIEAHATPLETPVVLARLIVGDGMTNDPAYEWPRPPVSCDYRGALTGLKCANPDAVPHHCYTAASDAQDRHDDTEPYGSDQ